MVAFALLKRVAFAFALIVALVQPATAQSVRTEHVTADLIAPNMTIEAGKPFTLGLRLKMIPGWHTYWVNPGTGLKTEIEWQLPKGFEAGPIQWPYPRRLKYGPLINYGYENEVTLTSQVTAPANLRPGETVSLKAHAKWLVCEDICVPEEGDVGLELKVGAGPPARNPAAFPAFAAAASALPKPARAWTFAAESSPTGYLLVATPGPGAGKPPSKLYFFAAEESVVTSEAAQPVRSVNGKIVVSLTKHPFADAALKALRGVWVSEDSWGEGLFAAAVDVPIGAPGSAAPPGNYDTPVPAPASAAPAAETGVIALLGTLVAAFIGGLILNLMPCVFPVIGLKIMGFAHQAGQDRGRVIRHGLAFTAGVLISFWILAGLLALLRAGGEQLGWGFQLQSPEFVFILAAVLLAFGMNLSGAFEFGMTATGVGQGLQQKSGIPGSFFAGLLTTLVATPCAAPFLSAALGAAAVLPTGQSFLVFTVIGLGLSFPYLLLSIFPQAVKRLPRPGAWMETFKQLMAFPLYATVVYLLWVLAGQLTDEGALNAGWGLVALATGLWAYGRWTRHDAPRRRLRLGVTLLIVFAAAGAWLGWPGAEAQRSSEKTIVWEKWSPEAVARLQGEGRTIYVDFTARWCATCQVNEALVFNSNAVVKAFQDKKIATLKADWTSKDPAITAELAKYGRSAIPFNLVYTPGKAEPAVLPEYLTPGIVLKAIE